MAYDVSTPEGRRAAAERGDNTLGTSQTWTSYHSPDSTVAYDANGQPMTQEEYEARRAYAAALADEDARRFEVGQSNVVASRQQTALEHADQVKQARALLKQRQYEFDTQNGPNSLNERKFTEDTRRFGVNTGIDLLKTGATMRGPLNAFQGAAFARGIQTGGLAPYLQTLSTNGTVNAGGGTATSANPTPLTVGTLTNELMGTGQGTGTAPGAPAAGSPAVGTAGTSGAATDAYGRPLLTGDYATNLNAIDTVAKRGLGNLGQGALENMSPGEAGTFSSGLAYLGRSPDDEIAAYRRSRAGQGNALGA